MGYIITFLSPSGIISCLFILGTILLALKKKRAGKYLLAAAGITYIVFGTGPVSFWLLGNLEYRYPPINSFNSIKNVKRLVILAGHAEHEKLLPLSSEVNSASAFRIIEAVRIYKQFPDTNIIISGYDDVPMIMKELLVSLGITPKTVMIDDKSANTYESAVNLREKIGSARLLLVTSAGHMPRAMGVFNKQGINAIPAPTDFRSKKNFMAIDYLPSPLHLEYSDLAVHEYLGILWYKINNRI